MALHMVPSLNLISLAIIDIEYKIICSKQIEAFCKKSILIQSDISFI